MNTNNNTGHKKETGGNYHVTPLVIIINNNNNNNKRETANKSEWNRDKSHETPSGKKIASNLSMTPLPPHSCHVVTRTGD